MIEQTFKSLLALSVGDATGENQLKILPQKEIGYYKAGNVAGERNNDSILWPWTDDTQKATGLFRILRKYNTVNQVEYAKELARNYAADSQRGYGKGTARLLFTYSFDYENWETHSRHWWGKNCGSKGNGSAMSDSIVGPHFGLDYLKVVREATLAAEVTHFHPEAIHGSIAVALAAAVATYGNLSGYWSTILKFTPSGDIRDSLDWVSHQFMTDKWEIVQKVGNGSKVTALDTVPFAVWQAFQTLSNYYVCDRNFVNERSFSRALDNILEVGGDTDTVGAIVGGIVGNQVAPSTEWLERTERLPIDVYYY